MNIRRLPSRFALACFGLLLVADAHAVAGMGGVVAISMVPGSGSCNVSKLVPLDTPQDRFALGGTSTCDGQSGSADLYGDAANTSVGLRASASGGQSSVAAQVYSFDRWLLTPPPGTPAGLITIPVTLRLDGTVSGGADPGFFNRFLDYNLSINDAYTFGIFSANGSIATSGSYSLTFSGSVDFRNFNQASLPMTAEAILSLSLPGLAGGVVDFYNTSSASMALPTGFTATTSSGVALPFSSPVPESGPATLLLLGLAVIGTIARRRMRQPR
jgi:hypothetical protein